MKWLRLLGHLLLILFLTALTQIGGVLYLLSLLLVKKVLKRWLYFSLVYVIATFVIVPLLAPSFGREPIETSDNVKIHTFFTRFCNRNYVSPKLQESLKSIATAMQQQYPGAEIHCLDANFPFWDGFPLLPHLSHDDGRKLDISLMYKDAAGLISNLKPSRTGYGVFEEPRSQEYNQIEVCQNKGYWQYDFAKYLRFGVVHDDLQFAPKITKDLLQIIVSQPQLSKVFIEPHLRDRMGIRHTKIRYHGCRAVRHDDHIHLQVK